MNFTLSTKPFCNALNLGVVNANVSRYYQKSNLAQLTATSDTLEINLEAASISTSLLLRGSGDSTSKVVTFVDCSLLKSLVGTFDASTTTIEFNEGGIVLHSGSSKFTLPKMIDDVSIELAKPGLAKPDAFKVNVDASNWKFIADHQMYAKAMSFVHPVYTRVWFGEGGDVIVGDFDNSLFTLSKKNNMGETFLLTDTVVNLFTSLPEGAILSKLESSYRIDVKTDGFEYAAEFTPQHESDEGVGDYNAPFILDMAQSTLPGSVNVSVGMISKALSQSDLLARATDETISLSLKANVLQLKDANVDCKVAVDGDCPEFESEFKTSLLKSVISNIDEDIVKLAPYIVDDAVMGIFVITKSLTVILGGIEQ